MAVEFKVTVQDTPGTLARLGAILGEAGINSEAIQGTSREGKASSSLCRAMRKILFVDDTATLNEPGS